MKQFFAAVCSLMCAAALHAQPTQTLRGQVNDQVLGTPLAGATITLTETGQSTLSDSIGFFRFEQVPVGTYTLQATYVGYLTAYAANIMLGSGKEQVITIALQAAVADDNNVVVKANSRKNRPLNQLSVVSARAFTVEETQRYAAAVNDPARMATAFAGVVSADDGNNNIIIRGNAPNGLLWRMEGIEIPNPNHFAASGTSGGGISILSAQLLSNSDFLTGAFAAEYGNAQSGVFDLKLRKGNDQQREYTLQAGVLGLNLAAEGPFKKGGKSSYLMNYRYSTLSLLHNLGVNVGDGTTNFQDYAYNFSFPTKKAGTFTLFGFGGFNDQERSAVADSSSWESDDDRYAYNGKGKTMVAAATHFIQLGAQTTLYSAAAWSKMGLLQHSDYLDDKLQAEDAYHENNTTTRFTISSTLNHRFSAAHLVRAGVIANQLGYTYHQQEKEFPEAPLHTTLRQSGHAQTVQAFTQWQTRFNQHLSVNLGFHTLWLSLNNRFAIEPRASVAYNFSPSSSLSFGYGMHHRTHPLGVYFARPMGSAQPNLDLDFTRANHYVLSWQQQLTGRLRLRTELYYQQLNNVPVSTDPQKTFSLLNHEYGFVSDGLVNKGSGYNYGLEVSLERYLANHFYLLWSNSLYNSQYRALDGVTRNTRFNGGYTTTLTAGKEWPRKQGKKLIGVNIKSVYAGGLRQTPIDLEASKAAGHAIYLETQAYSLQQPAYFRTDLRFSLTWHRTHHSSVLSIDFQNLTNRANVQGRYYDATKAEILNWYGTGIIPVLNYKIEL